MTQWLKRLSTNFRCSSSDRWCTTGKRSIRMPWFLSCNTSRSNETISSFLEQVLAGNFKSFRTKSLTRSKHFWTFTGKTLRSLWTIALSSTRSSWRRSSRSSNICSQLSKPPKPTWTSHDSPWISWKVATVPILLSITRLANLSEVTSVDLIPTSRISPSIWITKDLKS